LAAVGAPSEAARLVAQSFAACQRSAGHAAVEVVALSSGESVFEHRSHDLMVPASLAKIATGYAALSHLGAGHRFRTEAWAGAPPQGGVLQGDLWIKGEGDPFWVHEEAALLVGKLRSLPLSVVTGSIQVDSSAFEPAAEYLCLDGHCERPYNPVISATSLDFNAVTLRISPGPAMRARARIEVLPAGDYASVQNRVTTGKGGAAALGVTVHSLGETAAGGERWRVTGEVAEGGGAVEVRRNVRHPASFMAHAMKGLLAEAGVTVRGRRPGVRAVPPGGHRLAHHESPQLAEMLTGVNRYSNNYMAEMLLRALGGAVLGPPGTKDKGLRVVREALLALGISAGEIHPDSGSGLSRAPTLSAHALCRVLTAIHRDPRLAAPFLASLAVSGQEGTLRRLALDPARQHAVRGKTGTLQDVVGFAGYVDGVYGETYAVTVMLNEVLNLSEGKAAIDRLLADLASSGERTAQDLAANSLWAALPEKRCEAGDECP
jgi:D-alanyl-D-alanine carboxypeptidase/D-alanyl-D-alanine-endopeptidase (penicillin-binding protein 4)